MGSAARLAAYGCALALVFGLAFTAGRLVATARRAAAPPALDRAPWARPDGLAAAAAGYRLAVADATFVPGTPGELRFAVLGPDGTARHGVRRHTARSEPAARRRRAPRRRGLPASRPGHGRRRHLAHPAHPARAGGVARLRRHDADGGAHARARRRPLRRGPVRPVHLPAVAHRRRRRLPAPPGRRPGAGVPSQVFATVSRDGAGVTDLQPYLGGFGKLVALREGDLAYTAAVAGNGAAPAPDRPRGPRGRVHGQRPEFRDLSPLPAVPCGRCHAHGRVHRADEEPMTSKIDLTIGGMTCASCANRVERKLNKLDGVVATVNYATEKAHVSYPEELDTAAIVAEVEAAGYTAALPVATPPEAPDPVRALRGRFLVVTALAVPVIVLSMVPALQFPGWEWVALVLAAPAVLWGAWPLHRAAATNLRHGTATMDTLISLGTLAALGWSVVALLRGEGMTYLEVGAGVTAFVLLGRWLEARSKRSAGAALTALLDLGAKEASVLARRRARCGCPRRTLQVGDRFVVRPGETIATDGVVDDGSSALDVAMLDGRVGAGRGAAGRRGGRRVHERRRPPGRARHPGRRRHPARPDGPPRRRRAERQGGGAAARGPGVGGVRPGRDRARRRHAGVLAGQRGRGERRVHGRGRRADHRLPVRAGPGDADGAARRHRPRRAARRADQGPGGAGVHAAGRHRGARQDRHPHHGADGACTASSPAGTSSSAADGGVGRAGLRAPGRAGDRGGRAGAARRAARRRRVRQRPRARGARRRVGAGRAT